MLVYPISKIVETTRHCLIFAEISYSPLITPFQYILLRNFISFFTSQFFLGSSSKMPWILSFLLLSFYCEHSLRHLFGPQQLGYIKYWDCLLLISFFLQYFLQIPTLFKEIFPRAFNQKIFYHKQLIISLFPLKNYV